MGVSPDLCVLDTTQCFLAYSSRLYKNLRYTSNLIYNKWYKFFYLLLPALFIQVILKCLTQSAGVLLLMQTTAALIT